MLVEGRNPARMQQGSDQGWPRAVRCKQVCILRAAFSILAVSYPSRPYIAGIRGKARMSSRTEKIRSDQMMMMAVGQRTQLSGVSHGFTAAALVAAVADLLSCTVITPASSRNGKLNL